VNRTDRKAAGLKAGDPEEWWDEKVPGGACGINTS